MTQQEVHDLIREHGGIVHGDGNIFFTNAVQFGLVVAAMNTEPSQEYAELPEPNSYCTYSDSHEYDVFDAEQMHAYADATHALRTGGKP